MWGRATLVDPCGMTSPEEHGWKLVEGAYEPHWYLEQSLPDSLRGQPADDDETSSVESVYDSGESDAWSQDSATHESEDEEYD